MLEGTSSTWSHSVQFSCSVVSDSLLPHGLQYAKLPCPSPSPGACSNSCPSSHWCHPTISSFYHPLLLLPSICQTIRVFSNKSAFHIRWPKYWIFNFSISPSDEYSGLISFRIDWFDLLAVQETLRSLLQHHSSKASILRRVTLIPRVRPTGIQTKKLRCLSRPISLSETSDSLSSKDGWGNVL